MCEGVRVGVRTAGGGAADEVEQLMHRPVAADLLEALDDDSRDEALDAAAVNAQDTKRSFLAPLHLALMFILVNE